MSLSTVRERIEVTEIGLRSEGAETGEHFGTGVMLAILQI
jgi:hypothetical protein